MLSKVKMAIGAVLVLTTASAAIAQGTVSGCHPRLIRHHSQAASDWGCDGYGCTNFFLYLYDSHDCYPRW
jgi:hypothetical protein